MKVKKNLEIHEELITEEIAEEKAEELLDIMFAYESGMDEGYEALMGIWIAVIQLLIRVEEGY